MNTHCAEQQMIVEKAFITQDVAYAPEMCCPQLTHVKREKVGQRTRGEPSTTCRTVISVLLLVKPGFKRSEQFLNQQTNGGVGEIRAREHEMRKLVEWHRSLNVLQCFIKELMKELRL